MSRELAAVLYAAVTVAEGILWLTDHLTPRRQVKW